MYRAKGETARQPWTL